jgi:hypothetical protein
MAWADQTKNTSSYYNQNKNAVFGGAIFDVAKFDIDIFGNIVTPVWADQTKNTSAYTDETKH